MTSKEISKRILDGSISKTEALCEVAFQLALLNENIATLTIVHSTPESWEVRGTKKP